MKATYPLTTTTEELNATIDRCRKAQAEYATFTQEQVDKIFLAAATAANKARIPLAPIREKEPFFRLELMDTHGRRAYSQPYWFE